MNDLITNSIVIGVAIGAPVGFVASTIRCVIAVRRRKACDTRTSADMIEVNLSRIRESHAAIETVNKQRLTNRGIKTEEGTHG